MNGIGRLFTPREALAPRHFWTLTLFVCLIGLALRVPHLGRSLWLDESYSAWFSMLSLHELWTSVPLYETHPPMYYTLLKGWCALFGNSEAALRAISVVASMATILLLAVSGRVLGGGAAGDRVSLLAALLLAVNNGNIEYAASARPYALETFTASAAILSSFLLLRRLQAQGEDLRLRPLVPAMTGLAVSGGMTLWLHTSAVMIALGIWTGMVLSILLLVRGERVRQAMAVALPGAGALLIWAPFLPFFLIQSGNVNHIPFWVTFQWDNLWTAWSLAAGGRIQLLVGGLVALQAMALLWRRERPLLVHLVILLVLPVTAVLAISYFIKPVFLDRLFEWMAPPLMALIALGLVAGSWKGWLRRGAAVAMIGASLFSISRHGVQTTENWRGCLDYISSRAEAGDLVVAIPNELNPPIAYYTAHQNRFPEILFVPAPFPALGLKDRAYVGNLGAPGVLASDRGLIAAALRDHRRVWLIERNAKLYDPQGIIRSELATSRRFAGSFPGYGITLERFD